MSWIPFISNLPRTLLVARDGTVTVMVGIADLKAIRNWYDAQSLK